MAFIYNSLNVDFSVGLPVLTLYSKGDYGLAVVQLLDVLDAEPRNWQARLLLGACYYKTDQFFAAQRVFQFIYEHCPEEELKCKSLEALLASHVMIIKPLPAEFGCYVDRTHKQRPSSWLDEQSPKTQIIIQDKHNRNVFVAKVR